MGLKRNRKRSRRNNAKTIIPEDDKTKSPRILVISRGSVGPVVSHLINDIQTMLAPNVVRTIKVLRSSRVKHLVSASGPLDMSHAIIFTRTDNGLYMKLCTFPHGPTVTFSIQGYCLQRDVLGSQKRPFNIPSAYQLSPPFVVLSNITPNAGPKHLQLVSKNLMQIFPTLQPDKATTRELKRCCLLSYDETTEELELRHYVINLASTATARLVSKLVNARKIPDLRGYEGIEDALERAGAASESEGEEATKVEVSREQQGDNDTKPIVTSRSSVKIRDAGPRVTMKIHKIECGLLGGEVLYNRTQSRTAEEIVQLRRLREHKMKEKMARKQRQDANVARKQQEKEDHKDKCNPDDVKQKKKTGSVDDDDDDEESATGSGNDEEDYDDDVEYYKEAVGEDPGDNITRRMKRRMTKDVDAIEAKKRKVAAEEEEVLDAKRAKAKERYKLLDSRRQKKRPSSFGKRRLKKIRTQIKQRADAQKAADKSKEQGNTTTHKNK